MSHAIETTRAKGHQGQKFQEISTIYCVLEGVETISLGDGNKSLIL